MLTPRRSRLAPLKYIHLHTNPQRPPHSHPHAHLPHYPRRRILLLFQRSFLRCCRRMNQQFRQQIQLLLLAFFPVFCQLPNHRTNHRFNLCEVLQSDHRYSPYVNLQTNRSSIHHLGPPCRHPANHRFIRVCNRVSFRLNNQLICPLASHSSAPLVSH